MPTLSKFMGRKRVPSHILVTAEGIYRICPQCQVAKPLWEFWTNRVGRKAGTSRSYCKQCSTEYHRQWRHANRHRTPIYDRRHHIKHLYGLTEVRYQEMFEAQDGRCAICGRSEDVRLAVDHDAKTGEVRGLLCKACNLGIGSLDHDPERLRLAAEYLQRCQH